MLLIKNYFHGNYFHENEIHVNLRLFLNSFNLPVFFIISFVLYNNQRFERFASTKRRISLRTNKFLRKRRIYGKYGMMIRMSLQFAEISR